MLKTRPLAAQLAGAVKIWRAKCLSLLRAYNRFSLEICKPRPYICYCYKSSICCLTSAFDNFWSLYYFHFPRKRGLMQSKSLAFWTLQVMQALRQHVHRRRVTVRRAVWNCRWRLCGIWDEFRLNHAFLRLSLLSSNKYLRMHKCRHHNDEEHIVQFCWQLHSTRINVDASIELTRAELMRL